MDKELSTDRLPSRLPSHFQLRLNRRRTQKKQTFVEKAKMTQIFYTPQDGLSPDWHTESLWRGLEPPHSPGLRSSHRFGRLKRREVLFRLDRTSNHLEKLGPEAPWGFPGIHLSHVTTWGCRCRGPSCTALCRPNSPLTPGRGKFQRSSGYLWKIRLSLEAARALRTPRLSLFIHTQVNQTCTLFQRDHIWKAFIPQSISKRQVRYFQKSV